MWLIAIGAGLGAGLVTIGAGLGIGKITASAAEATGRQPEAAGDIETFECTWRYQHFEASAVNF